MTHTDNPGYATALQVTVSGPSAGRRAAHAYSTPLAAQQAWEAPCARLVAAQGDEHRRSADGRIGGPAMAELDAWAADLSGTWEPLYVRGVAAALQALRR